MVWLKTTYIRTWLNQRTSSWLGLRCFTRERSDRTARSTCTTAWQFEELHYTDKFSTPPPTASIRKLSATAAANNRELCHFGAAQAFLKVNIDEEIYIEIPEVYQDF